MDFVPNFYFLLFIYLFFRLLSLSGGKTHTHRIEFCVDCREVAPLFEKENNNNKKNPKKSRSPLPVSLFLSRFYSGFRLFSLSMEPLFLSLSLSVLTHSNSE